MLPRWRRARATLVRDFGILRVLDARYVDPRDGSEHERVLVESPEWANVVPVTRDGDLILVRQFRIGSDAESLEIPGGIVDDGEDPAAAVARELEEETGYRARATISLGWVWANPAFMTNRVHFFLATDCQRVHDGHQERGEHIAVELRPLASAGALVRDGSIRHPYSIAALYQAELAAGLGPRARGPT